MACDKTIIYHGTTIEVWEQSLRVGKSQTLWFKRPITDSDILAIKTIVDAGRDALATQLRELRKRKEELLR
jgi:hypothetical protein